MQSKAKIRGPTKVTQQNKMQQAYKPALVTRGCKSSQRNYLHEQKVQYYKEEEATKLLSSKRLIKLKKLK